MKQNLELFKQCKGYIRKYWYCKESSQTIMVYRILQGSVFYNAHTELQLPQHRNSKCYIFIASYDAKLILFKNTESGITLMGIS